MSLVPREQGSGERGVCWQSSSGNRYLSSMSKEKMVITGARHGMAGGGWTVVEEDGTFQAEWREYRTGLIYEGISLSQHFHSIALGVSLNGHLVSPALF